MPNVSWWLPPFRAGREWVEEKDIVTSILFTIFYFLSWVVDMWESIFPLYFHMIELFIIIFLKPKPNFIKRKLNLKLLSLAINNI